MNSAIEKIKEYGGMTLGLMAFLALISVPLIFIAGSVWAAKHLLQPLITVGWFAVAIDLVILLPLSIFRSLRGFTGGAIFISSLVFGAVTWLLSIILTYALLGIWSSGNWHIIVRWCCRAFRDARHYVRGYVGAVLHSLCFADSYVWLAYRGRFHRGERWLIHLL